LRQLDIECLRSAISVDTFDDLLERDRDFARRVLEIESRRLQQLIQL
jgi:CRP-like cAMP-binding protein